MKTPFIITTLSLLIALAPLGTAAQWVMFRIARVEVTAVTLFYGSPVVSYPLFGTTLEIGYLPFGCRIQFDVPEYKTKPLPLRLAVILAPPAIYLLIALTFLGWSSLAQHFVPGFAQIYGGALHPRTTGLALVEKLYAVFSDSIPMMMGIIAAKFAVVSLLPLGGTATSECMRQLFIRFWDSGALMVFLTLSYFTAIALGLLWMWAIILFAMAKAPGP